MQGTDLPSVGKTQKAEGEQNAQHQPGATTAELGELGELGSLDSFGRACSVYLKGTERGWTGQRHGALCARLRHLDIKGL